MGDVARRDSYVNSIRRLNRLTQQATFVDIPLGGIQDRLTKLHTLHDRFMEEHNLLVENQVDAGLLELHHQVMGAFEDTYYIVLDRLQARLAELQPNVANAPAVQQQHDAQVVNAVPPNVVPPNDVQQNNGPPNAVPLNNVVQPNAVPNDAILNNAPLDINTLPNLWGEFNGSRKAWRTFRDRFLVSVHENPRIPPIFKFQLLKKAIVGEAANIISGWDLIAANYDQAWTKLGEVYDDDYLIRREHMKALHTMPRLTHATERGIRRLIDTTHQALRQLIALDVQNQQNWDATVVHLMIERLDPVTFGRWERARVNDHPTVNELTAFLEKEVRALAHAAFDATSVSTRPAVRYNGPSTSNARHKPGITHRTGNPVNRTRTVIPRANSGGKCRMCKKAHAFENCQRYLQLDRQARWKFVQSQTGLCYNCFGNAHLAHQCLRGPCSTCGKRHHPTLCLPKVQKTHAITVAMKSKIKKEAPKKEISPKKTKTNNGKGRRWKGTKRPHSEAAAPAK